MRLSRVVDAGIGEVTSYRRRHSASDSSVRFASADAYDTADSSTQSSSTAVWVRSAL